MLSRWRSGLWFIFTSAVYASLLCLAWWGHHSTYRSGSSASTGLGLIDAVLTTSDAHLRHPCSTPLIQVFWAGPASLDPGPAAPFLPPPGRGR